MIKSASQFSGIGAFECALENLKLEHENVMAVEFCKYARLSFLANFKEPKHYFKDSYDADYENVEQTDIFLSSPPCQAFSLAGKRLGELDKRGILFYETYRFISVNQPKVFIIENVKGLLSAEKGTIFQNWIELLGRSVNGHEKMFIHEDSLEYNLHYTVLNSKNFGVPQNRERVFIVGIRKDLPNDFRFPIGWRLDKRLRDVLETNVEEKYYLSDKMLNTIMKPADSDWNSGKMKIDREIATALSATMHKMHRADTDNYVSDEIHKLGFINQDTQASKVYGIDGISPTLSSGTHGYAQGYIQVKEATKKGYDIAEPGDSINMSNPNSTTRRGRVGKGIANTLETSCNQAVVEPFCVAMRGRNPLNPNDRTTGANLIVSPVQLGKSEQFKKTSNLIGNENQEAFTLRATQSNGVKINSRIRRLLPIECFRLQGFSDEFFYKCKEVNSDTQLYRQSGNTITVSVIQAIINNLKHLLI